MRVHGPKSELPADAKGGAVALGNFDGAHAGHQAVIEAARACGGRPGVALFTPHPRRYLNPDAPPFALQSPAQRARALDAAGVAELYEIGFDALMAQSTDREFAENVLQRRLGVRHVCVGADFRFGRGRMGNVDVLKQLGAELGFDVSAVAPVDDGGGKISSTKIRAAIAEGEMSEAARMLTRPWAVEGKVQRGFARGRGMGFPTANVALGDYTRPRLGVYAVRARLDGVLHNGVASIGVNPTTGALAEPLLEAHLFDFDGDLYGRTIEVELAAFLREERRFAGMDALQAQIAQDAEQARRML